MIPKTCYNTPTSKALRGLIFLQKFDKSLVDNIWNLRYNITITRGVKPRDYKEYTEVEKMKNLHGVKFQEVKNEIMNDLFVDMVDTDGNATIGIMGTTFCVAGTVIFGEDENVIEVADDAIIYDCTIVVI